jgi:benzodiazapine receptor
MDATRARLKFLGIFLVVVLGVGFSIGLTIRPGAWYEALEKPFFTPPNWVFGPVWTVVYSLIAVAGWRVALTDGFGAPAFKLWVFQMLLNWAWTPIFFGLHFTALALGVIVVLLAVALVFMTRAGDRIAKWCFGPYVVWLAYASALNAAVAILN